MWQDPCQVGKEAFVYGQDPFGLYSFDCAVENTTV